MGTERQLVFHDDRGHTASFTFGDRDHLKFFKAFDSFLAKHLSEDNTTFRIERVLTDETLIIETAQGIVGRARGGTDPETGYRRYERHSDGSDLQVRFAHSGYPALDAHGPWTADRESLLPEEPFENFELTRLEEQRSLAEQRRAIAKLPKLDRKALNHFCRIWGDTGYNEYVSDAEGYYVLFDSRTLEEVAEARAELLKTVETLGLDVVDTPSTSCSGEVWVRTDPRADLELEKWA